MLATVSGRTESGPASAIPAARQEFLEACRARLALVRIPARFQMVRPDAELLDRTVDNAGFHLALLGE